MKLRRITFDRTDHFCNFDGIAKTLFCCHRKRTAEHRQSLSAVSGRKRYNTLDFAGQNRVPKADLPALLWKPPGYRQHHFRASERNAFCRYSFSPACCKIEKSVLQRREKMRGRATQKITWIIDLCDDPRIIKNVMCAFAVARSFEKCISLRKNSAEKCGGARCFRPVHLQGQQL